MQLVARRSSACFITLEGIEGVGKSTQLAFIAEYLQQKNISVTVTREPGGTPIAEAIRGLLLSTTSSHEKMTAEAELLLFFAARAQHIHSVIAPALSRGDWVVCDRFTEASYAYQGAGRGIDAGFIDDLQKWVQEGGLAVDCVLLFDAPVELALGRTRRRGQLNRIDAETLDFFSRVRACYLARAEKMAEVYQIIDASLTIDQVQSQIKRVLDERIRQQ